jgi:hypothetical protein
LKGLTLVTVEPTTTFASVSSFPVSAGIGIFNATFAAAWPPSLLAYEVASQASILLFNFLITFSVAPVTPACSASGVLDCSSYLFSGGKALIYPKISGITAFPNADAFSVESEQCIQGDYWSAGPGENLTTGDCLTWGEASGAFMICVTPSVSDPDNLIAGTFSVLPELMVAIAACPATIASESQCLDDISWKLSVQISTSVAFSRRTANTFYARNNGSLIAVANISDPSSLTIQPADLLFALNRFFGDAPLAPNQTSTTLSLVTYVWSLVRQVQAPTETTDGELYLRSLLTLPILWFQPNAYGDTIPTSIPTNVSRSDVPPDLLTTAHLEKSNARVVISLWTVIVFLSVGTILFVWCITLMAWAMSVQGPEISHFPLLDFASRIAAGKDLAESPVDQIAPAASGSGLKQKLQGVRLYLRDLPGEEVREEAKSLSLRARKIGFSTMSGVGDLKQGVEYT